MLTIRESQLQAFAAAAPNQRVIAPCRRTSTWIQIELRDADGLPVAAERYRLQLPDQSLVEGALDANGTARVEGIVAGECVVSFPDIDGDAWDAAA